MKTVGNIIWVIFGGFELALATLIAGIVMCATIVGIPVGVQLFKVALFTLWPFGKTVKNVSLKGYKKVINIIWACVLGWVYFLLYSLIGVIFCITIIGIPFGKQYFKLATFVIMPLGHDFR